MLFYASLANSQSQPSQITIATDGSVIGTDSIQHSGNTYTLTENLNASIILQKDNITLDGANFTLYGLGIIKDPASYHRPEKQTALSIINRNNDTIKNFQIVNFGDGISLINCSNCIISGNKLTDNNEAIILENSSINWVTKNTVESFCIQGIALSYSSNNNVVFKIKSKMLQVEYVFLQIVI